MEKELVWKSTTGKRTKLSEFDHQYLSNVIWFNYVFHGRSIYNDEVQRLLEEELQRRFEGKIMKWRPLPIPNELDCIRTICKVDEKTGNIFFLGDHIGYMPDEGKKISLKEAVLRFVESKVTAKFTEIQKFATDYRSGEGTYEKGYVQEEFTRSDGSIHVRKINVNRGLFCGDIYRLDSHWTNGRYRLVKVSRGTYRVQRD